MLQEDEDKTSLLSPHCLGPSIPIQPLTALEGTIVSSKPMLRWGYLACLRQQEVRVKTERDKKAESKTQNPQSPPAGRETLKPAGWEGRRQRIKEKRCFSLIKERL